MNGMQDGEQCSDTELLLAARTCSEPFGVFYERHFASVLAFFRRRTRGPEEAFDLTAETFAAALGSVSRFQPGPEPPQAWLFAIARHKLSEALRSSRIQDEARRALAMQPIELDDEAIEILEMTSRAPAIELLETLAPEQREAIQAHHVEERGYAEIAAELHCSESVVRKRVSRGLAVLQAQFRKGEAS
jgi:RNA polymerase sigma factor (sigma-70 family)